MNYAFGYPEGKQTFGEVARQYFSESTQTYLEESCWYPYFTGIV